jgi:hypothetical protein
LSNLSLNTGQSGPSIRFTSNASYSQATSLHLNNSGGIDATSAAKVQLSNIVCVKPTAGQNTYAIDLGDNQLSNVIIDGANSMGVNTSVCHGIRTTAGSVINCQVDRLAGGNGITATSNLATLVGNRAFNLGGGTPIIYVQGNIAHGNFGYPATATAMAGAATLHAESGVVTSEPITTGKGLTYTLVLTNQLCMASSRITADVQRGTDTQSLSYQVQEVIAQNGTLFIVVKNTGAAAIGTGNPPPNDAATIKIHFKIEN